MAAANPNSRLEAFCDGVFAIALTLLIIDIGIPSTEVIKSTPDLWQAIEHLLPSIFAFILSFIVIFITWANHHHCLGLVHKSSSWFLYANGFLLLTVVLMPFPTALLGEYLWTDYAAPAVVIYNGVIALQALGWILLTGAALAGELTKSDKAKSAMRVDNRSGCFAFALYSILAIIAFWFPLIIAAVTALLWLFWLVYGIRNNKSEQTN